MGVDHHSKRIICDLDDLLESDSDSSTKETESGEKSVKRLLNPIKHSKHKTLPQKKMLKVIAPSKINFS